ncbi:uncharacterized protein ARMOST_20460 [Armillaria ostoyae]|uniref:Uncharacterized protein n=1 Tax=Armillaria ostoyae TaxID=47428 RepID=A0A284S7E0_ARMOS|nr:uncharacterized protein ARMOST_20460 [Armillaria ostoyae]
MNGPSTMALACHSASWRAPAVRCVRCPFQKIHLDMLSLCLNRTLRELFDSLEETILNTAVLPKQWQISDLAVKRRGSWIRDAWASCINVERNLQLLALRSIAEYHSSEYWMLTSPTLFSMLRVPRSQQRACKSRDSWALQAVILVQIISSLIKATRHRQRPMFTQFWREPIAWLKHQIIPTCPSILRLITDLSDLHGIRQSGRSISFSEALHFHPLVRLGKNHFPNPSPAAQDDGSTFNQNQRRQKRWERWVRPASRQSLASFTKECLANRMHISYLFFGYHQILTKPRPDKLISGPTAKCSRKRRIYAIVFRCGNA